MNSHSLTNDLILEILSRLPAKSVARFHCVSKRWASMFVTPYFKDLFLARSSAKPRVLFAVVQDGVWRFFSSPQLEKSSSTLVAAAEFHVKFSPHNLRIDPFSDLRYFSICYASGLIYLYGDRYEARPVICNPITGWYAILPYIYRKAYSVFGFDPIDKQYKVLSMIYPSGPGDSKILTFGGGDMRWSKIKYPVRHDILDGQGICINGVLYYLGDTLDWDIPHDMPSGYVIVCFDLRSENFTFIGLERFCHQLINYKGKLAVTYWENDDYGDTINELHVWVLENVEKQEWSKYAYTLSDDKFFSSEVSVAGMTASGEIVFSMRGYITKKPFYVFYFNPEKNNLRRVEIQGFEETFKKPCTVYTFVDHVEDLNVNDLKQLKSAHPPLVSQNIIVDQIQNETEKGQGEEDRDDHWS